MKIIILSHLLLLFISCKRELEETNTSLQLQVPKKVKISKNKAVDENYYLNFLVLNITGKGIEPRIIYKSETFDSEGNEETIAIPPQTVPSGTQRLVQFLGVYSNINNKNDEIYYYGSLTKDLNGGQVNLTLPVKMVGSSQGKENQIFGQFADSCNDSFECLGPTGEVAIYFQYQSEPKMLVEYDTIINGWFQFFISSGARFSYEMANTGRLLFDLTTTELDSKVSQTTTNNNIIKIDAPAVYYFSIDPTNDIMQTYGGTTYVGFFGPALKNAQRSICFPATLTIPYLYSDMLATVPMSWLPASTAANANTIGFKRINGGRLDSHADCTSSNNLKKVYTIFPEKFVNGMESIKTFKGSFALRERTCGNESVDDPVLNCYQDNNGAISTTFSWGYIPGVFNSAISGFQLFYRTCELDQPDSENDCDALEAEYLDYIYNHQDSTINSRNFCNFLSKNENFIVVNKNATTDFFESTDLEVTLNDIPVTGEDLIAYACPFKIINSKRIFSTPTEIFSAYTFTYKNKVREKKRF